MYGFLLNNERFTLWQVGSPAALVKQMQDMLREMGNYQQNHELAVKELADTQVEAVGETSSGHAA